MNYQRVYDAFMVDRRTKEADLTVSERHHIIPEAMGGKTNSDNLIRLSPEDHLFAHALLAKIHGGGNHWFSVEGVYQRWRKSATPRMVRWDQRARKEIGKLSKAMHARPGHKEKLRASMEKVRPTIAAKLRENFKSPDARHAAGNGSRGRKHSAEETARRAASLKKALQDPERRKLYSEKQKAWSATPEGRAAKRRASLTRWDRN